MTPERRPRVSYGFCDFTYITIKARLQASQRVRALQVADIKIHAPDMRSVLQRLLLSLSGIGKGFVGKFPHSRLKRARLFWFRHRVD